MANQKKSFEFRMSKKVAELTQVVHMLFTRNHEKEVEIEALKEAYEHEITLVIKDARSKLDRLDYQLREAERQTKGDVEKQQSALSEEFARREAELQARLTAAEATLQEERQECQNVRDLLIQAQHDIETLRGGQSNELSRKAREISDKTLEIDRLKQKISDLERNLNEKDLVHSTNKELRNGNALLKEELSELRESLEGMEKYKDEIVSKNRQLESDIKHLRRELAKRAEKNSAKPRQEKEIASAGFMDYNEEVERLRRQVQQYRMELSNRELNFNRMFTEKMPVQVDGRGPTPATTGKRGPAPGGQGMMQGALPSFSQAQRVSFTKEKTNLFEHGNGYTSTEVFPVSPQSSVSSSYQGNGEGSRLPQLSMDPKQRLHQLIKPKPLPREILSGKAQASGH